MSEPLRYKPDDEHRFFCYSPEGDGLTFWRTPHERDAYAAEEIRTYLNEGEWWEEVEGIIAGVITHSTKAVNIKKPQGELDEDGYDECGDGPWSEPDDVSCDYALLQLPAMSEEPRLMGQPDILKP